jgi:hypothetical protein
MGNGYKGGKKVQEVEDYLSKKTASYPAHSFFFPLPFNNDYNLLSNQSLAGNMDMQLDAP